LDCCRRPLAAVNNELGFARHAAIVTGSGSNLTRT
jgi:hypothetical protein